LARRALTSASVDRIKPPTSGQVEHFDKGFPGLALRISYGGGRSFVFFYRIGGKLKRLTLGTYPAISLADAREAWRVARQDVAAGKDPALSKTRGASDDNFENVARDWLKRDQSKNKSVREVERVLARELIPVWGHRAVTDISRRDIRDLIDGVADRGSPVMALRVHAYVHRFFRWCVGRDIIETNPATDLPKPASETKRDRVLSDQELAAIWKAAGKIGWPFGDAIRLLILTGARREEIGQLKWSEIRGDVIELEGARTKSAQPHTIPLSLAASTVLRRVPRVAGSARVFTTNGKTSVSGWSRAKANLDSISGVKDWRIHDFRRTVATGLQKLGIALVVIEATLGHTAGSRSGIVSVYQRHSFDAEKRTGLEAWGAHVSALVERLGPDKVRPIMGAR
jgi:integrase